MLEDDELCKVCAQVDLRLLFSGPRYYPGDGFHCRTSINLGTLQDIQQNSRCPLCRLVKHEIFAAGSLFLPEPRRIEISPAKVLCSLSPARADYYEDTTYQNKATRDLLATKLEVIMSETPECTQEEAYSIRSYPRGNGILLLSPESTVSGRPLLNGYHATTVQNSLDLVSRWVTTCQKSHKDTCCPEHRSPFLLGSRLKAILVIEVQERKLVDIDPVATDYATLSYVWGQNEEAYAVFANRLELESDKAGLASRFLPSKVPKVIEDAILVCKAVSIPYLWVDLYCVNQVDQTQRTSQIQAMGFIYHCSLITLVAASTSGLLSGRGLHDMSLMQKVETVGNQQLITALPSITDQIHASTWSTRGWCFQEGQLASRIAFFGDYDVSFICGAGHWRESFHSGEFGHDADIKEVDLSCGGYYTLSALSWLRERRWYFEEYESIVLAYSQRKLTYESDRIKAISGCLEVLAQKGNITFFSGLPSADLHYALLWYGEYDRPREGFPSWSWAGWYGLNQMYVLGPHKCTSGALTQVEDDHFEYKEDDDSIIELQGLLIRSGMEKPHLQNKCLQSLASLTVSNANSTLTVQSETARFFVEIIAEPDMEHRDAKGWEDKAIPADFDTTKESYLTQWDPRVEYSYNSYERLRLRDAFGNILQKHARWYDHPPFTKIDLPKSVRGSTLTWLLRDGIELLRILDVKLLEGAEELLPFHHVLCLGLDRSEGTPNHVRRMGMFCIPEEAWDKAGATAATVSLS